MTPKCVFGGRVQGCPLSTGSVNGTNGLAFSGTAFSAAGRPSVINQNGDVVYLGAFAGGIGAWRNMAGSNANTNLGRGGSALPAPAASGNYSTNLAWAAPMIDSAGNAMFFGPIVGTNGPAGWIADSGSVRASTSGAVNFAIRGTNAGTQFEAVGAGTLLPTDRTGAPVMQAQARTTGVPMNNNGQSFNNSYWRTAGGAQVGNGAWVGTANAGGYDTLTVSYLQGDTVSGFGYTGIQADFIANPSFNDNARYAANMDFISGSGSPSRTSAQNRGLATNRNGATELLMIRNVGASWLPAGVIVGAIGSITPSMNNTGQIAL